MKIEFAKYHGAGNDFIVLNDLKDNFKFLNTEIINKLCDRHFGIGANGLIRIQNSDVSDFKMIYYNSDGKEGSMCGNGSRCAVVFANNIGVSFKSKSFTAYDGLHAFQYYSDKLVKVGMNDVSSITKIGNDYLINTGSPHLVIISSDIDQKNIKDLGAKIRYSETYKVEGVNVNFIEIKNDVVFIRTYERGVEDETLACGTGCTAAAIISSILKNDFAFNQSVNIKALGGLLKVDFTAEGKNIYKNIFLEGPVEKVFEGSIVL
jgi:diaminopimelate epimerase